MSWREAVFNIVLCLVLFSAGFVWHYYFIFFGSEADKVLVLKTLMFVGGLILASQSVRYVSEGEYCIAALFNAFTLLMIVAAVYAL